MQRDYSILCVKVKAMFAAQLKRRSCVLSSPPCSALACACTSCPKKGESHARGSSRQAATGQECKYGSRVQGRLTRLACAGPVLTKRETACARETGRAGRRLLLVLEYAKSIGHGKDKLPNELACPTCSPRCFPNMVARPCATAP